MILLSYSWYEKTNNLQKDEKKKNYQVSNTNRLILDHKTVDVNLIEPLLAYVFDGQLNSSLMELNENLPLKLPFP